MHNSSAHYLLTDAPPVSKQRPLAFFPPCLLLRMMSYGMEYSFGLLESAVPAVSPPNFLCTFSLFTGGVV